jgi:hypothetical protein
MKASVSEDPHHPFNDLLWNSDIVKYMMAPHPAKYPDNKRKKGS